MHPIPSGLLHFSFRYVRRRGKAHAVIVGTVASAVLCARSSRSMPSSCWSTRCRSAPQPCRRLAGFRPAGGADRRRQSALAHRELGRQLHLRRASPATCAAISSATSPATRPATSPASSPGALTSRVTATSNALFTVENMLVWNVLPPCLATVCAIAFVGTVSVHMAAGSGRGRGARHRRDVSQGRRRQAAAPRVCQSRRRRRRRDDRRGRQHGDRQGVRRHCRASTTASMPRWSRRWRRGSAACAISSACASAMRS